MKWYEVAASILPALSENNYAYCESAIADAMSNLKDSPFHKVLNLDFSNNPQEIGINFDNFILEQNKHYQLGAIYTETNGFDINTDKWYCDLFGYKKDFGLDDPDWFSDWRSETWPNITLKGMEELQTIYESMDLGGEETYMASLMVVVKFQKLIYSSKQHMKHCNVPIYSTGHGYDFFAKC